MTTIHPYAQELARLMEPSWPAMSAQLARSGVPTCEVAEAPLKDKLKNIEAALGDARDELRAAAAARDEARTKYAQVPGLTQNSPEFRAAKAAVAAHGAAQGKVDHLVEEQITTLKLLGRDDHARDASSRAYGPAAAPRSTDGWDSGAVVNESNAAQLAAFAGTSVPIGRVALGQIASRDAFAASFGARPMAADVSGTTNMRRGDYAGIVPQLRRQLRVLDLLPTGTMDGRTLPYSQESGSFATATETAEGVLKPEAGITLTDQEADAKTIAHWLKIRKQALADAPALQSIIDSRLRYGVERRLEDQVLAGAGIGENILGILNTTGIGAVPYAAGTLTADQVLSGLTAVLLADALATGIVMNPLDWRDVLKAKAAGDGHYFSGGPFAQTPQVMWGVPLIPTAAIPQGMALVGDFTIGAQLFIREGVNVLLSDSDQDNFVKNVVTMLAELRAALAVFRPAAFCTVRLTA